VIALLPTWLWHPFGQCGGTHSEVVRCHSYNFWSGIGSDISEITLVSIVVGGIIHAIRTYRKHTECHEERCSRHGKYVIEGGVRCCDVHHPALDERPHNGRGRVHALHIAHLEHMARMQR
jgi:hypothetical protein